MKTEKSFSYKIMKPVIIGLFKLKYRPKIIGKENIPKSGPIIVCGNHKHILDQFLIIMSTNRMIHYMAKKEYFEGKFKWFFKTVGCIPVNRQIKDTFATDTVIDLLNNGYAAGIFPEGTRNAIICKKERLNTLYKTLNITISKEQFIKELTKQEVKVSQIDLLDKLLEEKKITIKQYQKYIFDINNSLKLLLKKNIINKTEYDNTILLPFKFGAVKMAQKTNATIIPFAVTGKYISKKGKLTIHIAKPIKVKETDDLEKINNKLRNTIINLIKENDKTKEITSDQ